MIIIRNAYYSISHPMIQMLSLNAFGLPKILELYLGIETQKGQRIDAIAEMISVGNYDLILLQEVWVKSDYDTIKNSIPSSFHITSYDDFNVKKCVRTGAYAGIRKSFLI